ncbi:hypothetical protein OG218_17315 [Kineococcus sp. NBC_00420]|uniref:hypothetical protein n=1 Tax=unclassified Kineococcus TaxID=2621656 RepID=UPI002E209B89
MTLRRALPVVVTAALLALALAVLLRQPTPSTAPGTVTRAARTEVCLRTAGHDVCLDREHVDHLGLSGLRPGDCVAATWTGDLLVAESLVRVVRSACAQPA